MNALDEYLNGLNSQTDKELALAMHHIISEALPDAEVRLSYGLVGYYQPKQICFFGINQQHIGFYPTSRPIQHFQTEIAPYLSGKTTLKFKKDLRDIPSELVQKIAIWNLEQV